MKKPNFITDAFYSVTKFDYYKKIANRKISENIKYFFKLVIIYSIILTICGIVKINKEINKFKNLLNNDISEITYTDGNLNINNDKQTTLFNKYVIIDTSVEETNGLENKAQIVITKKYATLKMDEYVMKINYKDYLNNNFTKQDIINFLDKINVKTYIGISIILLIWIFILLTISVITDVVIVALIGAITAKMFNKNIEFSKIFGISIHGFTLPIILAEIYYLLNAFTGFYMRLFSVMYTLIAIVYTITAVILMFINDEGKEENNK